MTRTPARALLLTALISTAAWVAAGGQPEPVPSSDVDSEIQAHVTRALEQNPRVGSDEVTVTVDRGVVTLMGTVESVRQESAAIRAARGVAGVTDVVDDLDVAGSLEAPSEEFLEIDVRTALETSSDVDATGVVVNADGAEITLLGSVSSGYAKDRATRIATAVPGVETVTNELSVVPPENRPDSRIKTDVLSALERNALIDEDRVSVDVSDGVVTLSGEVDNAAERREARDVALLTDGVVSVDDSLAVVQAAPSGATEQDIREVVREQLEWDARVDASNIDITVNGSQVTLTGTVDSARQKSAAVASAESVRGVTVLVDRIEINLTGEIDGTQSVSRQVRNKLTLDPALNVDDLQVTYEDGVITLSGSVTEAWQRREAARLAEATRAVTDVVNGIVVLPENPRSDGSIRSDVEAALEASAVVDAQAIIVTVSDGVVTLRGEVDDWVAHETAVDLAIQVSGVTVIEDELTVD